MTTMDFNNKLISMEQRLERFALSLTANREEAKDLLQETYLKALSSKDKFIDFLINEIQSMLLEVKKIVTN